MSKSTKKILSALLMLAVALQPAWAQNTGLFNEWSETDYSEFEITHEYFTPDGTAPSSSGGYDMTGYIPVKEGDVIVVSGDRSPGIPFMMGYTDDEGQGATVLLGDFDANNWDNLQVTDEEVTIPAGTAFVRCSARNTSLPQWANRNLSVIKHSFGAPQRVIRILCIGNSFSADTVESWLSSIARTSGFQLVIGNAVRGGWGLRGHWADIVEGNAETEYRKIVGGTYSLTPGHTLSEIINDEPWDVITFQQASQESGIYSTYSPYLGYLIGYVKGIQPQAKLGWIMTWAYAQDAKYAGFANYNNDQMTMYNAIVDANIQLRQDYSELEFLVPCGTSIQNLRTSIIGDNVNRDGIHLDLKIGRLTAAYTMFATLFGEEATTQNTYHPQLGEDSLMIARQAALDAVRNPFAITTQNHPDIWQDILSEHGYNPATVTDLTDSAKIKLPEPSCSYVNITGINLMPTTKTENLQAWLEFYDAGGTYFKKRVILNAQGNSSLDFVKKNVSVKFYEESWGEGKTTDITFGNWVKQDVFHLKAYYTDYFRGCGKIAYDIYDDITSDREMPLPWQRAGVTTASKKAMCHPNGFPCYVYLNGKFYGLFVWSLKKDRKNMGQEKDNTSHIHLDGTLAAENIFNGKINWSQFEVRNPKGLYCVETTQTEGVASYKLYDGDNPTELIDSTMPYYNLNNPEHVLTNKVKQSIVRLSRYYAELQKLDADGTDSETFKRQFSQYFDTQGLTDYFVHSLVTNNYDGHGKNWQWFTYDGTKWYVEPYDLDCTFGHHASGLLLLPPEWNCHNGKHYYQFQGYAGVQILFLKYYFDEIKERYIMLREKRLIDAERYSAYFRAWTDKIGQEGFDLEYAKWNASPCIMETIANPNWETEDDWENFNQYPVFSQDVTYHAGDKCTGRFRIWTATATTKGVVPYKQMGQVDSQERMEDWIRGRISLLDEYFSYDPNGIKEPSSGKQKVNARKVILAGHLYIIKDGKIYSVEGKRKK